MLSVLIAPEGGAESARVVVNRDSERNQWVKVKRFKSFFQLRVGNFG